LLIFIISPRSRLMLEIFTSKANIKPSRQLFCEDLR
jgi:hypothetical protein